MARIDDILDAITESTWNHHHIRAAAAHWDTDRELGEDLLNAAILRGAKQDALLQGWSWKDALAALWGPAE